MPDPRLLASGRRRGFGGKGLWSRVLGVFPLLLLPVLIYIIMAIVAGKSDDSGVPAILSALDASLFSIPMVSGVRWQLRAGDCMLLFSLLMLSIEIVKSTSTTSGAIFNHAASMMVLLLCLVNFLLFENFATSVFFLLSMMTLLDVLAGVMVTIVSARRDFGVGDGL